MNNKQISHDTPVQGNIPIILVTPELAQKWLDTRYEAERRLRLGKVAAFARDMREGKWRFIGDPIRFDEANGNLVDGQHRLQAVVDSGQPQLFPVLHIPFEDRAAIDTGTARTLGDVLNLGGHVMGRELAAIVRRLLVYYNADGVDNGRYLPSHPEGVEFVQSNRDELLEALQVAQQLHRNPLPVAPSPIGAAYFLCARVDRDDAEEFFHALITGEGLHVGHPALALRNKALRSLKDHDGRRTLRMHPDDCFRFTIMAWNRWRDGVNVTNLIRPKSGWQGKLIPQ